MNKYKKRFKNISSYGYILPLGIILTSFYVIPILMSIYFSFTKYNIMSAPKFIGLDNYASLFKSKVFLESLKNTAIYTFGVVPVQTILAMLMAIWLTKRKGKISNLIRGVMFIPVISSMVLISIIWRLLLTGGDAPIAKLFSFLNLTMPDFLGSANLALPTLMGIAIWKNVGYFMVIYIAAIMDIPKSYYEAARVDGASKWEEFWNITVPMLKPTTIMVVFLGIIWSFQSFDIVYTLTGGGPGTATMTLVLHIYNLAFKQFNAGEAMAVANILFFIIAIISIFQKKFLRKEESTYY
ncbi:sugar ABC transporter permease [Hathewaya histolytica]|uniref:Sugar transporter permease n=1 Tax=Hathewaya histolytica TaxID=1498 RepID=A0A4U9QYY9_HATHI|nr:sugar ABC transporter permease [Hathewaya histolytica]VTQ82763.1 sugar transporter permease [Hathewaya histolytica]